MEQILFYAQLNTAKLQFGDLRNKVNAVVQEKCIANKELLSASIALTINQLNASLPFFATCGKKYEVDIFIICYLSLLARLNSS